MANLRVLSYLEKSKGYSQEQKEEWFQVWAHRGLEALEKNLQEFAGTYSFGDTVTLADVFVVPQVVTCQRFKTDMSKYSTVMKIFENCQNLDAFTKAHPFRQPDTPAEMRIP